MRHCLVKLQLLVTLSLLVSSSSESIAQTDKPLNSASREIAHAVCQTFQSSLPWQESSEEEKNAALARAENLNILAVIYREAGKYQLAEKFHKDALNIRTKYLGREHPETASSLNNLGVLYFNLKRYSDA